MPSPREPDAPTKRTQTSERTLRAVREGESGPPDWRDGIALDGAQEVVAQEAIERYLSVFRVTVDKRTDGWMRGGEGMSTADLTLDLVGYFPTVLERTFRSLLVRYAREVRHAARREVALSLCERDGAEPSAASVRALRSWTRLLARSSASADELEVYTAAWRQLIWQVKRRLMGKPTYSEVMVVLSGCQGSGKSSAIGRFASPLEHLYLPDANFTLFSDSFRRRMMQTYYLVVLDEMARAKETDIDEVKRCITAPYVQARQMHSQAEAGFTRNASFIGCTNDRVEGTLQDGTGMRRFVEVRFRECKADAKFWTALQALDMRALWGCVSYREEVAPISRCSDLLQIHQEELMAVDPFEQWYSECVLEGEDVGGAGERWNVSEGWPVYEEWCRKNEELPLGKHTFLRRLRMRVPRVNRSGHVFFAGNCRLRIAV